MESDKRADHESQATLAGESEGPTEQMGSGVYERDTKEPETEEPDPNDPIYQVTGDPLQTSRNFTMPERPAMPVTGKQTHKLQQWSAMDQTAGVETPKSKRRGPLTRRFYTPNYWLDGMNQTMRDLDKDRRFYDTETKLRSLKGVGEALGGPRTDEDEEEVQKATECVIAGMNPSTFSRNTFY